MAMTILLSDLVASGFDVIGKALSDYPAPTPEVRAEINKAILKHYWMHEIGMESPDVFAYYLDRAMCEIMPLYNQRYNANMLLKDLDPNVSYTETYTVTGTIADERNKQHETSGTHSETTSTDAETQSNSNSTAETTATGHDEGTSNDNGWTLNYAYPMTGGSAGIFEGSSLSKDYASSGEQRDNNGNSTADSNSTASSSTTGTESGTSSSSGKSNGTNSSSGTETDNGTQTHNMVHKKDGSIIPLWEAVKEWRDVMEDIVRRIVNDQMVYNCFSHCETDLSYNGWGGDCGWPWLIRF